jgi:hypothetical protein
MEIIRDAQHLVKSKLHENKAIIITGARRVGKTFMIRKIMNDIEGGTLFFNGEDFETQQLFAHRTVEYYRQLLGGKKFLIIDEAQKIPEIGNIVKLIVDSIEGTSIILSGSSAFDINNLTGEPLTGRKYSYYLFPFSENEYRQVEEEITSRKEKLKNRLVYGNYPELIHLKTNQEKQDYLKEIINSYLFKDILAYENIRNSSKIVSLLRLIAFQIGGEVSLQELGKQLAMSKNTVEKYLDLLSKVFIIFKVEGFSRNLRKEIIKNSRWYFYDNGIRNTVIANLNPLETRNDIGMLWENYMISERIKYQNNNRMLVNNYFWRTYGQQEIDWVEEREGKLFGYEFKWAKSNVKPPSAWAQAYPDASFEVISMENYQTWLIG